jgi:hypothetical protein
MPFDYSKTGLPDNVKWKNAAAFCNKWLDQNMSMFGPERIASFMEHQPVAAAKLIIANCPDYSEESITLALLGPARQIFLQNERGLEMAELIFGSRTVALMKYMDGRAIPNGDTDMPVDANRLFLVEGLSGMNDQIIGRAKIDKHHQVRWNMLNHYESTFAGIKGENPGLDKIFAGALVKSRTALEALDNAPKKQGPKPPQP